VVNEVIGISFTPSREYSNLMRWDRGCMDGKSFGVTPGDTIMMGMRTYRQAFQCPNGLPSDESTTETNPMWRARIEKAKRDTAAHRERIAWQQLEDDCAVVFAADDVARLVELVRGAFDVY